MNENLDASGNQLSTGEKEIEKVLRPSAFGDFAGQPKVVENLDIFVSAARQRGEALDHVLLHGLSRPWQNNSILHYCQRAGCEH